MWIRSMGVPINRKSDGMKFDEIVDNFKNASRLDKRNVEIALKRLREEDADDEDFTYHLRDFGEVIFEIICPPEPEPEDEEPELLAVRDNQLTFYCRQCEKAEAFNLKDNNWICSKCGYVRWTFQSIESLKND